MLSITKEFTFDAAHRLWSDNLSDQQNHQIYGKCAHLHGHTFRLQITVSGTVQKNEMIIDFNQLKTITEQTILSRYDHTFLNDLDEYKNLPVTLENMVCQIFAALDAKLCPKNMVLHSVVLYETPTSWATMTREDYHAGDF